MANTLSIKDLENLSGIKAHTIRIWEKRYSIFDPVRTETNIRTYSNNDLKKLLNVVTILDSGKRISHVCSMSNDRMYQEIESLKELDTKSEYLIAVNDLILATLNCDSNSFQQVFEKHEAKDGLESVIENLIYPLLERIGLLWTVSKLNPSQEHFASQLIRQKIFSAIDKLPRPNDDNERWVLFLPQHEHHEIALLYSHYLLSKSGRYSVYLGPNLPISDAQECAELIDATHALVLLTIPLKNKQLQLFKESVDSYFNTINLHIGGINPFSEDYTKNSIVHLENLTDFKKLL